MCFFIDKKAKKPHRVKAYKVVELSRTGRLSSIYYSGKHDWNTPGGTVTRSKGRTMSWGHAEKGIYVYHKLEEAEKEAKERNLINFFSKKFVSVVLLVHLKPADWLHTSKTHRVSTYEKVVIAENQPFLEWFD